MGLLKGHKILLCSLFFFFCSGAALAVPIGYTDYNAFMADLPGSATTLDFDSLAYGTIIADGGTVDGISFDYPVLAGYGVSMMITSDLELGTDDGGMFLGGDGFELSFAAASAVGMHFISGDDMFDDDITLSAGGDSIGLIASDGVSLGGDDWYAYSLGIIDVDLSNAFTTASITSFTDDFGPYFL